MEGIDQQPCIYMDEHAMSPQGFLGGDLLIPTRVSLIHQKEECTKVPGLGGQEHTICNFKTIKEDTHFVSGVENYTLMFPPMLIRIPS